MTTTATPAVHLPAATLRVISGAVRSHVGREGPAALRAAGVEIGREIVADLEGDLSALPADEFWHRLADRLQEAGWGRFSFRQPHSAIALLESGDCAEADPEADLRHPGCHLTTGLIAAALEQVGGATLSVLEVTCRSAGDDLCRFVFGGHEALQRLHGALAAGTSFDEAVQQLGQG